MSHSPHPPVDLDRFWVPPPGTTPAVHSLRQSLSRLAPAQLRISRVAQLDASLLDNELESLLVAPIRSTLASLPGPAGWEPELMLGLRLVVLYESLWKAGSTYGEKLQNLVYRNHRAGPSQPGQRLTVSQAQRAIVLALAVVPSYLRARVSPQLSSWADEPLPRSALSLLNISHLLRPATSPRRERWLAQWRRVAWEVTERGEKLVALLGLVNLLVFLYDGRYRTLGERLARMRLVYNKTQLAPNVSFEFLNRQLVWEAFTEFLLFLLPLLPLARIRLLLARRLATKPSFARLVPRPLRTALGISLPPSSISTKDEKGFYHGLAPSLCAICMQRDYPEDGSTRPAANEPRMHLPYEADCRERCTYCYWCLGMELGKAEEAGEGWECLRCRGEVHAMARARPLRVASEREQSVLDGGEAGSDSGEEVEGAHVQA